MPLRMMCSRMSSTFCWCTLMTMTHFSGAKLNITSTYVLSCSFHAITSCMATCINAFVQPELQLQGHNGGCRGWCVPGSTCREAISQSYENTELGSLSVADPLSRHSTFTVNSMSLAVNADTDLAVWGPEYSLYCRSQHEQACQSGP